MERKLIYNSNTYFGCKKDAKRYIVIRDKAAVDTRMARIIHISLLANRLMNECSCTHECSVRTLQEKMDKIINSSFQSSQFRQDDD